MLVDSGQITSSHHTVIKHGDQEFLREVEVFLRDNFLFWLEAMSGLDRVREATTSLRKIATSPTTVSQTSPSAFHTSYKEIRNRS